MSETSNSSENLAVLINFDELSGGSYTSSARTTPLSRIETPALSDGDPGVDAEVRFEDLMTGNCDIQGVNWSNFSISREGYRNIRY